MIDFHRLDRPGHFHMRGPRRITLCRIGPNATFEVATIYLALISGCSDSLGLAALLLVELLTNASRFTPP